MDRNVDISFRRGIKKANGQYSLDDPYSVLDNSPGTPKYWQKRKREMIARLDNLGAFQQFFTLTCADMRWNENFTVFLQDYQLTYEVINGLEECFVTDKNGDVLSLDEFIKRDENKSKYEFIRKNVLTATLHFNHRVEEFFAKIIMSKKSKMPVKYYNYRVEFQLRGAGHIHGCLWLDLEKLGLIKCDNDPEEREAMDEREIDEPCEDDPTKFSRIFDKLKNSELGAECVECQGSGCDECVEDVNEVNNLTWLVDRFITCTLKDPSTRHLAQQLQQHKHFPQSCRKHGTKCRFGAPWLPCLRTVLQVPPKVKFKDVTDKVIFDAKVQEAADMQKAVSSVLEDEEFMAKATSHRAEEIEAYLTHRNLEQKIANLLEERSKKDPILSVDPEVLADYQENVAESTEKHSDMLSNLLLERQHFHEMKKNEIPLKEIKRERLDLVISRAGIPGKNFEDRNEMYEYYLSVSLSRGYRVLIKRDIDEIMTNNYNPEWLKCWNANMDMQFCGDYFAVITYITDYYMKDDSGILPFIRDALKQNENQSLREKLNLVKNTFLTKRQVGESELYYKLFPHLHLVKSNIAVEFVFTGFQHNRSRFLKQITEHEAQMHDDVIQVEGKDDRYYVEKKGMLEMYLRRPQQLHGNLSFSQFVQRYVPGKLPENFDLDKELRKEVTAKMLESKDIIFSPFENEPLVHLPSCIPLVCDENTKSKGEAVAMRRRSPRCLRFKKFKQETEAHEHMFSQMMLFLPFTDEAMLEPTDHDRCQQVYLQNINKVERVRSLVMPHLKSVTEARIEYELECAEGKINDIGRELDPENELDGDACELDGVTEHADFQVKDPANLGDVSVEAARPALKDSFRKIIVEDENVLADKIKLLDVDQRYAFEIVLKYGRDFVKATKRNNPCPEAPLLIVHGGAGTGKSHLIHVMCQTLEKIFRKRGDDPSNPYILKLAFTGSAAKLIDGQTIHSVFKFAYNNKIMSAPDSERAKMRNSLPNLRLIIIDEISLVNASMLYQIHFRLSTEIFQNNLPFGGRSLVVLGDIMQLRPVTGNFVFSQPSNHKLRGAYLIDNLWERFKVVNLKTNHRQGENRDYADILERIRFGNVTESDKALFRSRVFARDDKKIPIKDGLMVSGTNLIVNSWNMARLNELPTRLVTSKALVRSDARGVFVPQLINGTIKGTALVYELYLKIGARVMLTQNLDVCDGLVNGSIGTVVGFEYSRGSGDSDERIRYVMVEFDDPKDGRNRRMSLSEDIKRKYPGRNVTHIEKLEVNFSQSSRDRDYASSGGVAVNFPLKLCFAATAHKVQGLTVKYPQSMILDMHCRLQCAMVYVMLSRVQSLSQLFILEGVPWEKVKPYQLAYAECERLTRVDITQYRVSTYPDIYQIVSLNVSSLKRHISDVMSNQLLCENEVICVQETWFGEDEEIGEDYIIPGRVGMFVSVGRGRGVAVFYHPKFTESRCVKKPSYQMAAVSYKDLTVINLYRSNEANTEELIHDFKTLIQNYGEQQTLVVCGDFNFCEREEKLHPFRRMLMSHNFISLLRPAQATHQEGRCLDQAYCKFGVPTNFICTAKVGTSSFSDHDAILITARHF